MAKTTKDKKNAKISKASTVRKNVIQVILLSLIIFTIIYVIYKVVNLAINPTDSFIIEQGKISQSESLVGYVIRDEKVIESEEKQNKLVPIKNEGEKVAVGETVFRYEAENEQEINNQINNLNEQIQTAMDAQKIVPSSDIKALEKQIEAKMDEVQGNNNIQDIKECKSDMNNYITKKAKISGELSPAGSYVNNLINERTTLEKNLKESSVYKNAPMGGIISYRIDGLESTLVPGNFENMNSKFLEELNLKTGQIVTTSSSQGKIINNFECYIVVTTNSKEAQKAEIGNSVKIKLSSNQEIPATIEYIGQEEKNRMLVLKITQGVEYLISYRKISLDIIWWEQEGLRVPNTSIIYENGLSYVIRTKSGISSKILVKIVKENEAYSIIKNYKTEELKNMGYTAQDIRNMKKISIYDEVLADPDIDKISKELN